MAGAALEATTWGVVRKCVPQGLIRVEQLAARWDLIATRRLAAHIWPVGFEKDDLVLHASDSNWLHELNYLKDDLLRRIRAHDPKVRGLIPRVATLDPAARGAHNRAVRASIHTEDTTRPPITTDEATRRAWLAAALAQISATQEPSVDSSPDQSASPDADAHAEPDQ